MRTASLLLLCLFAAGLSSPLAVAAQEFEGQAYSDTGCLPRGPDAQAEDYRSWIKPYTKRFQKGPRKPEFDVLITILDGDNLVPDPSATRLCGNFCCQMTTTYSLSSDGFRSMTRVTPLAVQGGGPDRLPTEQLKLVQTVVRDMVQNPPDDHARLPPHGRRLVLQVEKGDKAMARVYDRADLPARVQEILGVVGATTGPMWMNFKTTVWKTGDEPLLTFGALGIRGPHHGGPKSGFRTDTVTLAISQDRSMIVTRHLPFDKTVITDHDGKSVLFAVSDYLLDRRGIHVDHAFFTPDSRYVLLLDNHPAMYIYNTKSWTPVDTLPGLPVGASAFYPSSDWKHGVALLRTGEIDAWDVSKGQKLARLDLEADLLDISFSEDDSRFAVSSVRHNADQSSTFHLSVWDTNTGQFLREMVPPFYFESDEISRPMWWDHGKYLLADTRSGHWGGYMVAIWNAQSGQLRGGFSSCDHSEDPYTVGIDGPRLLKWCRDWTLMVWDLPPATKAIDEFEQSLRAVK